MSVFYCNHVAICGRSDGTTIGMHSEYSSGGSENSSSGENSSIVVVLIVVVVVGVMHSENTVIMSLFIHSR